MTRTRIALLALALPALPLVSASSPTAQGQDEGDERAFALAVGRRTFEGNCLMCHTEGMVDTQRLTPEQWAAEVEKMIGWGAPVPPEEKAGLIDYLTATYPTEGDAPTLIRLTLEEARSPTLPAPATDALPPGDPSRGAALHAEHCATCHGPDGRGGDLGLNLVARPVLLRTEEYAGVVLDGRRRMPGFRLVLSDQQVADTMVWLRSQSE